MKITVGFCRIDEAGYFLENGADEISCGMSELPSFCDDQNVPDLDIQQVKRIADLAHSYGRKFFMYANAVRPDWKDRIPFMRRLHEDSGVDGFIIASAEQAEIYPETENPPVWVIGILGFCFNSSAAEFYRSRGISRLIIPQHILPEEGLKMCSIFSETEFYYITHEMDKNIDGLCLGCEVAKKEKRFCSRGFETSSGHVTFPMFSLDERLEYFYRYSRIASFVKIVRFGSPQLRKLIFEEVKALKAISEKSSTLETFLIEAGRIIADVFLPRYRKLAAMDKNLII